MQFEQAAKFVVGLNLVEYSLHHAMHSASAAIVGSAGKVHAVFANQF